MLYKSEITDNIINLYEARMKNEGKHLLKTSTLIEAISRHIDLTDDLPEREELMQIGIKQVLQGRLYAHGFFSLLTGYFVNIEECTNLAYLQCVIDNKDNAIETKIKARNRYKEVCGLNGQLTMVPDENRFMSIVETKTKEELMDDLEADAV